MTQTDRWADVETLVAPVMAPALDEGTEGTGPVACAAHAPGAGGEVRLPGALVARVVANGLRAEAAIRAGDEATAVKRVADAKAVRAQMAPWSKMLPPDFTARTDAKAEALLARAHAVVKPGAAAQKKVMEALEKLERLEVGKSIAGPAWERTTREVLGATLMTAGKPKEALSQFEKDLEARPNRALALLGAARAARAAGDAENARGHYAALAELWSGADADLPGLAEVRAGAGGN